MKMNTKRISNPLSLFNPFRLLKIKDLILNKLDKLDYIIWMIEQQNDEFFSELFGSVKFILGETRSVSIHEMVNWYQNVSNYLVQELNELNFSDKPIVKPFSVINKKDKYSLTILTSLYKGGRYTKPFMENITNQTVFSDCELIIVDANSPENEFEIIEKYTEYYQNIRYIRLDQRIGIYDAWNLAIKESNSDYITNANLDDLHRSDAFELKIKALIENPEVDVVYSDVFYSFIENLPFNIIAKGGFRTNYPELADKRTLLQYNYPHNSPMWRRSLHDNIGLFNAKYKSAGDHEFWLRAAFAGYSFYKIEDVVTSYYHNPQGISTNIESKGLSEGQEIVKTFQAQADQT